VKSLVSARNIAGAFILVISSLLATLSFAATSNATPWPQDRSDLKPDPALKFGTLPNGMRYIVMHNNTPTDTVSLRFRFATGSIQENEAQQGIAHVLEHMAFRGSAHVADGEMDKILERIGLKFGADTNAFTSTTQTAYKFDLPNATDENVDTGLMLMREIASELNITDEALKTERGVVLSEMRLRDTPEMRAGTIKTCLLYVCQIVYLPTLKHFAGARTGFYLTELFNESVNSSVGCIVAGADATCVGRWC